MDLISREKVIAEIVSTESEVAKNSPFDKEWFSRLADRQNEIIEIIENATIVESRPKGEWIEGDRYSNHVCSICGEEAEDLQACGCCELLSDFCPHCGADMRGEE